jgi:hypothetical protein
VAQPGTLQEIKENKGQELGKLRRSAFNVNAVLLVDDNPHFLAARSNRYFHAPERRFQGGRSITTCDGRGTASVIAACFDKHAPAMLRLAVSALNSTDDQSSLEPHIVFQWREAGHRRHPRSVD